MPFALGQAGQVRRMRQMGTAKRPWWQVTRTVRQAYVLAGISLVGGGAGLIGFIADGPAIKWLALALAVWFILQAVAFLASGIMLHRHRQWS